MIGRHVPTAGILHDVFVPIGFLVGLGLTLLPTIVAFVRRAHRRNVVAVVNVLLGWTVIGWVVALVMAFGPRAAQP